MFSQTKSQLADVFLVFLKLGCTSFGGPIAHIGYFRQEFVDKRHWLNDSQFAQLLSICQFLPGPASSQLGFSLGLLRAGWWGGLAASIAFTAPSAILLISFASLLPYLSAPLGVAAVQGLKILALAVVAHGLLGMTRQLCPDPPRMTIAALVAVIILLAGSALSQVLAVLAGALAGIVWCRAVSAKAAESFTLNYSLSLSWLLLTVFALLLLGLPLIAEHHHLLQLADAFYRAGALVFGGGHVVLPLLEESMLGNGWVSADDFLAGYGAAQAVPGPMFTFAAYLGIVSSEHGGASGALIALLSMFLPGILLIAGFLPLWRLLTRGALAARAIAGINAAVVGLLGAALYDPIFLSAVLNSFDLATAIIAFMLLKAWRVSVLWVLLWCVAAQVLLVL